MSFTMLIKKHIDRLAYHISRIVNHYNRCVSIVDYGASTASTDNSAAIQAALTDVNDGGTRVGFTIIIPHGIWKITSGLLYRQINSGTTVNLAMKGEGTVEFSTGPAGLRGSVIYYTGTATDATILEVGVESGTGASVIHTGPSITGIVFVGNVGGVGSKCLHLSGVNRHSVSYCSFRDMETGILVDDDNAGNDCDWGLHLHNFYNNVKYGVDTLAGIHIVAGGYVADRENVVANVASYTQAGQVITFVLSAATDFSDLDSVLIAGVTDSSLDGIYTAQKTDSTHFDIYIDAALGATALTVSTAVGTVTILNTAIRCRSANAKISQVKFNGGEGATVSNYTVGISCSKGPCQLGVNGYEAMIAGVLIDGDGVSLNGKGTGISTSTFQGKGAGYHGIILGAYASLNSTTSNSYASCNEGNYTDRALPDNARYNHRSEAELEGSRQSSNMIVGTVTMPGSGVKTTVVFPNNEKVELPYRVMVTGRANENFYVANSSFTNTGFDIYSSVSGSSAIVDYVAFKM